MAMTEEFMNVFELQYVSSFKLYDKYLKDRRGTCLQQINEITLK